jgi:hypothetical protein
MKTIKYMLIICALFFASNAKAVDPAGNSIICLAGMLTMPVKPGPGGPACLAPVEAYFAIRIFDWGFDAPATAAARQAYLMTSPGAMVNAATVAAITAAFGTMYDAP